VKEPLVAELEVTGESVDRCDSKQGDIDLRIPAHQYMYRQNWESGQYLSKLKQRLETMKIIPDSLPVLTPKVEFCLRFMEKKFPSRVR
jgi:large subunit ribosomal protein L35